MRHICGVCFALSFLASLATGLYVTEEKTVAKIHSNGVGQNKLEHKLRDSGELGNNNNKFEDRTENKKKGKNKAKGLKKKSRKRQGTRIKSVTSIGKNKRIKTSKMQKEKKYTRKKRNKQRQISGTTVVAGNCNSVSCLEKILLVLKFDKDTVENYMVQKRRMDARIRLGQSKQTTKAFMNKTLNLLISAFGGRAAVKDSKLICAGRYNSAEASNVAWLLKNLSSCETKISDACNVVHKNEISAKLDACNAKMLDFRVTVNQTKDNYPLKCENWDNLETTIPELMKCTKGNDTNSKTNDKEIKEKMDKCKQSVSFCKRWEDQSLSFIATCKTGSNNLKKMLFALLRYKDKLKKVSTKITSALTTTTKEGRQNQDLGDCTSFTAAVTKFSVYSNQVQIDTLGSNETIEKVAKTIINTKTTTITCTSAEKAMITESQVSILVVLKKCESRITDSKQMLLYLTGTTIYIAESYPLPIIVKETTAGAQTKAATTVSTTTETFGTTVELASTSTGSTAAVTGATTNAETNATISQTKSTESLDNSTHTRYNTAGATTKAATIISTTTTTVELASTLTGAKAAVTGATTNAETTVTVTITAAINATISETTSTESLDNSTHTQHNLSTTPSPATITTNTTTPITTAATTTTSNNTNNPNNTSSFTNTTTNNSATSATNTYNFITTTTTITFTTTTTVNGPSPKIWLSNGKGDYEGNVFIDNRPVCDDLWGQEEADVVCRMLSFPGAARAVDSSYFGNTSTDYIISQVECQGGEESIARCHFTGCQSCGQNEAAGVVCQVPAPPLPSLSVNSTQVELRGSLATGQGNVFINGLPVCDDLWGLREAEVLCRSLGFPGAQQFTVGSFFGLVGDQFSMSEVACDSEQSSLIDCSYSQTGLKCGGDEAAGAICRPVPVVQQPLSVDTLVLANGTGSHEGNLLLNGRPVCDDLWDEHDASVVCKSLGFPGNLQATTGSHFGEVTPDFLASEVQCLGSEDSLANCSHSTQHTCQPWEAAGVICQVAKPPLLLLETMPVVLVGGADLHEGDVEVGGHPVCDDGWGQEEAEVICRQLGFRGAQAATEMSFFGKQRSLTNLTSGSSQTFQANSFTRLPFIASDFECRGNEARLAVCPHKEGGVSCDSVEAAGVICKAPLEPAGPSMLPIETVTLEGGDSLSGNLFINGHPVCDDGWSDGAANVACRMLGFPQALTFTDRSKFGLVEEEFIASELVCTGTEASLAECSWQWLPQGCQASEAAGVRCQGHPPAPLAELTALELRGGSTGSEGNVFVNGRPVCDDMWTEEAAEVVCRMLGHRGAEAATTMSRFGQVTGDFVMSDVTCSGVETTLLNCSFSEGVHCTGDEAAGVICKVAKPVLPALTNSSNISLANGASSSEGTVVVDGNNYICDDDWDLAEAEVVCRMLGYLSAHEATTGARYSPPGPGSFLANSFTCRGDESHIADCPFLSAELCAPEETAGVVCQELEPEVPPLEAATLEIRLEGGSDPWRGNVLVNNGSVCDDDWDISAAEVVCRYLGFLGAKEATHVSSFGPATGSFLLNQVQCRGDEESIVECSFQTGSNIPCNEGEAAGVICTPKPEELPVWIGQG